MDRISITQYQLISSIQCIRQSINPYNQTIFQIPKNEFQDLAIYSFHFINVNKNVVRPSVDVPYMFV